MASPRPSAALGSPRFGAGPRHGEPNGGLRDAGEAAEAAGRPADAAPPAVEAVVMLAGQVRANPLRRATGRGTLELPLAAGHTVLDEWIEQLDGYARRHAGRRPLPVRVMLDQEADFGRRPGCPAALDLALERDPSRLRGTGGLLSDIARDYADDARLLVVHASQLPLRPLAGVLAENPACTEADVTLVCTLDGQPSGIMLVRCGALRGLKGKGFIDLNEQALPRIAQEADVRVCRSPRPPTTSLRTTSGYLDTLRAWHGAAQRVAGGARPLRRGLAAGLPGDRVGRVGGPRGDHPRLRRALGRPRRRRRGRRPQRDLPGHDHRPRAARHRHRPLTPEPAMIPPRSRRAQPSTAARAALPRFRSGGLPPRLRGLGWVQERRKKLPVPHRIRRNGWLPWRLPTLVAVAVVVLLVTLPAWIACLRAALGHEADAGILVAPVVFAFLLFLRWRRLVNLRPRSDLLGPAVTLVGFGLVLLASVDPLGGGSWFLGGPLLREGDPGTWARTSAVGGSILMLLGGVSTVTGHRVAGRFGAAMGRWLSWSRCRPASSPRCPGR